VLKISLTAWHRSGTSRITADDWKESQKQFARKPQRRRPNPALRNAQSLISFNGWKYGRQTKHDGTIAGSLLAVLVAWGCQSYSIVQKIPCVIGGGTKADSDHIET
jgi:hypothetical protein